MLTLRSLLAAALLISSVRAAEFDGAAAGPALDMSSLQTSPEEPASPCECAAKPRCWKNVMRADVRMVALHKEEIEGALPNTFFPGTLASALRRPTSGGHFLAVKCGPRRRVCTDKRDILEERLIKSSLLSSLPLNLPEGTLYDPTTLKPTELGERTFDQVKKCRETLVTELVAVVLGPGVE